GLPDRGRRLCGQRSDGLPDPTLRQRTAMTHQTPTVTPAAAARADGTAAIWSGTTDRFGLDQVPLPELAPGEVLVRTDLAPTCASDLHTIRGDRAPPLPTVLGPAAIGRVLATAGAAAAADGRPVAAGDRLTWTIGTSCGQCRRCRRGIGQKCAQLRK